MTYDLAIENLAAQIPSHWTSVPFRRVAMLSGAANVSSTATLLSLSSAGIVAPRKEFDGLGRQAPTEGTIERYWLASPGNLVVNPMWLIGGGIGVSKVSGAVSPDYRVYRLGQDLHPQYVHHLLRSQPYRDQYKLYTRADTTFDRRVSKVDFHAMPILLPPLDEQRRIADFLDAETARIDQLVSAQLQTLEVLEERANSLILQAIGRSQLVTEGGDPVVQLRRVLMKLNRPVLPSEEVITAFRDGQVTARSLRRSEGYTVSASTEPQGQGVEIGDIVIHGLDGFAGAIGDSEATGNCSPVYHVCLPIDGGNSAFYGRLLKLLALDDYLALYGASARERAVDFRNWKIFGQAPVPRVEPSAQHEIGDMITKIRPLRDEVKRFNEKLTERRHALITAAVTGAITV